MSSRNGRGLWLRGLLTVLGNVGRVVGGRHGADILLDEPAQRDLRRGLAVRLADGDHRRDLEHVLPLTDNTEQHMRSDCVKGSPDEIELKGAARKA